MSETAGPWCELLQFWFSEHARAHWFDSTEAFDAELRSRFLALHEAAADGRLAEWEATPEGCLALVILLDQVPRNIFRGRPPAFATDNKARRVTRHALDQGFDRELGQAARMFLYLPLEHSEDLSDQERCVALMETLEGNPDWADYARKHREVVARFGRFPHRNAVLGRPDTPEEAAFKAEHGPGW